MTKLNNGIIMSALMVSLAAGCSTTQTLKKMETGARTCTNSQTACVRQAYQVSRTTFYRNVKVTRCPGCTSALANLFTTGKWQQTCATCPDAQACP